MSSLSFLFQNLQAPLHLLCELFPYSFPKLAANILAFFLVIRLGYGWMRWCLLMFLVAPVADAEPFMKDRWESKKRLLRAL